MDASRHLDLLVEVVGPPMKAHSSWVFHVKNFDMIGVAVLKL